VVPEWTVAWWEWSLKQLLADPNQPTVRDRLEHQQCQQTVSSLGSVVLCREHGVNLEQERLLVG